MTGDEFAAAYAARSGTTVERLRYYGRYPERCDCGDDICEGWAMGHQHEDAFFTELMLCEARYVAALPGRAQKIADQLSELLPEGMRFDWGPPLG